MQKTNDTLVERRLPIGAELLDGGVHFRVWATKPRRVHLVLQTTRGSQDGRRIQLEPEGNGYYSALVPDAAAGMLYCFMLDEQQRPLPDPASRFQPDGPAGLSQIVDPGRFAWSDHAWRGIGQTGQVAYEMHIGTFTKEGTFDAATRELAELARIGVTVVEVMPVADFPGKFGWGYDGVSMFAPTRLYGDADAFRRFVDAAHKVGVGVILDVVYNHFGNVENMVLEFSECYNTDKYENEWAQAINFDGKNCGPVREFFTANARYWIDEFHLDGFRFDATQSIFDASREHILAEVTRIAREAAGERSIYLVAENEPQDVRGLRSVREGGYGMDGLWNDDFHHSACVRLTGGSPAYYSDYVGAAEELIACIKHGFIYQGQRSQWQKKPRGTPTVGFPAAAFVTFLQNHDQVANSATGARIYELTSPGKYRAMTALWLLAPQTPLLFQGQEFAASSPFLFFADYSGDVAAAVVKGRAEFLSQFPELATSEAQRKLTNPADLATFERCKLDFSQRLAHHQVYDLHIDLLKLRREDPVFHAQRADQLDAAALSPDCLVVRHFSQEHGDRLLLVNFGSELRYCPVPQPLLAPPSSHKWELLWQSDAVRYGGDANSKFQVDPEWRVPAEAAVVLRALTQVDEAKAA